MVRVIRRGVDGVGKAVYTEKRRARAFTQSPCQPSAVLGLAATARGGGMNPVAGQRPIPGA